MQGFLGLGGREIEAAVRLEHQAVEELLVALPGRLVAAGEKVELRVREKIGPFFDPGVFAEPVILALLRIIARPVLDKSSAPYPPTEFLNRQEQILILVVRQ